MVYVPSERKPVYKALPIEPIEQGTVPPRDEERDWIPEEPDFSNENEPPIEPPSQPAPEPVVSPEIKAYLEASQWAEVHPIFARSDYSTRQNILSYVKTRYGEGIHYQTLSQFDLGIQRKEGRMPSGNISRDISNYEAGTLPSSEIISFYEQSQPELAEQIRFREDVSRLYEGSYPDENFLTKYSGTDMRALATEYVERHRALEVASMSEAERNKNFVPNMFALSEGLRKYPDLREPITTTLKINKALEDYNSGAISDAQLLKVAPQFADYVEQKKALDIASLPHEELDKNFISNMFTLASAVKKYPELASPISSTLKINRAVYDYNQGTIDSSEFLKIAPQYQEAVKRNEDALKAFTTYEKGTISASDLLASFPELQSSVGKVEGWRADLASFNAGTMTLAEMKAKYPSLQVSESSVPSMSLEELNAKLFALPNVSAGAKDALEKSYLLAQKYKGTNAVAGWHPEKFESKLGVGFSVWEASKAVDMDDVERWYKGDAGLADYYRTGMDKNELAKLAVNIKVYEGWTGNTGNLTPDKYEARGITPMSLDEAKRSFKPVQEALDLAKLLPDELVRAYRWYGREYDNAYDSKWIDTSVSKNSVGFEPVPMSAIHIKLREEGHIAVDTAGRELPSAQYLYEHYGIKPEANIWGGTKVETPDYYSLVDRFAKENETPYWEKESVGSVYKEGETRPDPTPEFSHMIPATKPQELKVSTAFPEELGRQESMSAMTSTTLASGKLSDMIPKVYRPDWDKEAYNKIIDENEKNYPSVVLSSAELEARTAYDQKQANIINNPATQALLKQMENQQKTDMMFTATVSHEMKELDEQERITYSVDRLAESIVSGAEIGTAFGTAFAGYTALLSEGVSLIAIPTGTATGAVGGFFGYNARYLIEQSPTEKEGGFFHLTPTPEEAKTGSIGEMIYQGTIAWTSRDATLLDVPSWTSPVFTQAVPNELGGYDLQKTQFTTPEIKVSTPQIAELAGFVIGAHYSGKALGEIVVKTPLNPIEYPNMEGGLSTWRGFSIERRGGAIVLGGVSKTENVMEVSSPSLKEPTIFKSTKEGWRFDAGLPALRGAGQMPDLSKMSGADYSATQTALMRDYWGQGVSQAGGASEGAVFQLRRFDTARELMGYSQDVKSAYRSTGVNLPETETMSQRGIEELFKIAKEKNALIYGSEAQRMQMPTPLKASEKGIKTRQAVDIDVQFPVPEGAEAEAVVREAVARLQGVGEDIRVSASNPMVAETSEGVKAIDFHAYSLEGGVQKQGWGFMFGQKPVKIGGTKFMPLSEQSLRKASSSISIQTDAQGVSSFAPDADRLKDVVDTVSTQKTLLASYKTQFGSVVNPLRVSQWEKTISEYETLFARELQLAEEKGISSSMKKVWYEPSPSREFVPSPVPTYISESSVSRSISTSPSVSASLPMSISKSIYSSSSSSSVSIVASQELPSSSSLSSSQRSFSSFSPSDLGSGSSGVSSSLSTDVFKYPSSSPSMDRSYDSLSYSPSSSKSTSISASLSPSLSVSPSLSPSLSPSISPSMSPLPSISISPSISPSRSPSISPSPSPSLSPSLSQSYYPSKPSPKITRSYGLWLPEWEGKKRKSISKKGSLYRELFHPYITFEPVKNWSAELKLKI